MSSFSEPALIAAGFLRWRCTGAVNYCCPDCGSPVITSGGSFQLGMADLNQAKLDELIALPRIGRVLAQRIVDRRPFHSIEELLVVSGITKTILEQIRPLVTVGSEIKLGEAECPTCMRLVLPLVKCALCKELLSSVQNDAERDCLSIKAYRRGNCAAAFAPDEPLWAFKLSANGSIEVAAESELRRRFNSGELYASLLVRSANQDNYAKADGCPEFQDVAKPRPAPEPIDPLWEFKTSVGSVAQTAKQSELVQRFLDGRLNSETLVRKNGRGLFVLAGRHSLFASIAKPQAASPLVAPASPPPTARILVPATTPLAEAPLVPLTSPSPPLPPATPPKPSGNKWFLFFLILLFWPGAIYYAVTRDFSKSPSPSSPIISPAGSTRLYGWNPAAISWAAFLLVSLVGFVRARISFLGSPTDNMAFTFIGAAVITFFIYSLAGGIRRRNHPFMRTALIGGFLWLSIGAPLSGMIVDPNNGSHVLVNLGCFKWLANMKQDDREVYLGFSLLLMPIVSGFVGTLAMKIGAIFTNLGKLILLLVFVFLFALWLRLPDFMMSTQN